MSGFFKNVLGAGKRVVAQVTNKDLLEGIVCGALHLAASGGISRDEVDQLLVSLSKNSALSSFSHTDLGEAVNKFQTQIEQSPRMAKLSIKKEVEEAVAKNAEWGTIIVAIALDVADQGGLDDDEMARAKELCGWCRVSPGEFGL